MIYSMLGVMALLGVYFLKGTDELTNVLRYILLFIALVFIWGDIYTYAVLPMEIGKFWNDGAGLTFGNATNNETIFGNQDEKVAYYISKVKMDWLYMEWARNVAFLVGLLMLTVYVIRFLRDVSMGGGTK